MRVLIEGHFRFEFPQDWNARKWDAERAYRDGIGRLQGSKAADIVAVRKDRLVLVETKDFRGYRIQNKARLANGELAQEVAEKVRDTLAGLIGARRRPTDGDDWKPFVDASTNEKRSLYVLLWLEEDLPPKAPPGAADVARNTLVQDLKIRLRWLTTKVFVASLDQPHPLVGVSVANV